jgi:GGDEF domain-containing protein
MEGARLYVRRVAERVEADPVLASYGVRVSAGLAAFDRATMSSGQDLLREADQDLYRQKARRSRSHEPSRD